MLPEATGTLTQSISSDNDAKDGQLDGARLWGTTRVFLKWEQASTEGRH
jgi:hypothetical protein